MEYPPGFPDPEDTNEIIAAFKALPKEDYAAVVKMYNLLSGGITDPQLQALLIYRHLIHTGWLPPTDATNLKVSKADAISDIKLLRRELDEDDKETIF